MRIRTSLFRWLLAGLFLAPLAGCRTTGNGPKKPCSACESGSCPKHNPDTGTPSQSPFAPFQTPKN